jgi:hypothetical protein
MITMPCLATADQSRQMHQMHTEYEVKSSGQHGTLSVDSASNTADVAAAGDRQTCKQSAALSLS